VCLPIGSLSSPPPSCGHVAPLKPLRRLPMLPVANLSSIRSKDLTVVFPTTATFANIVLISPVDSFQASFNFPLTMLLIIDRDTVVVWQLVDYSMNTANSLGKTELAVMHKFRFRLEAGNGEAYESEASAQNGIASVQENAAHTPSPVCLNNQPPCASIAERNTIGESGPVTGCTCF
jgi:uncharacterized protein YegP (UPF0339 family)